MRANYICVCFNFKFLVLYLVACCGFQMFHMQQSKQDGSAGRPQPPGDEAEGARASWAGD
jgi:hypothetical protein